MNIVGHNIKKLRQKMEWNQAEVAKRLEISIPAYSKIETGITEIGLTRLFQIAQLFEVSPADILLEEQDHPEVISSDEIIRLQEELRIKDDEVIKLQQKAIELYEELVRK
ncbi:DNA-binding transcriptional regulator, XRE-family HTH domain [Pedobacter hartonius]|uniref:DNA-binding transcriptional regulator, XRE-family HTH domain n=2 Tax=Pedobacter hartonius TaxID=425514 RepID=A0A1H4BMK6_9SPHI|nr:helix-turn-helix transcriptional regulator [Pedobacter hartonius]SEA49317.1 DNA-binding transcriptional regulator, XRE-family HTH domain [Pedobacter hartonius]